MALKAVGRDQALHITRVLGSTGEHLPGGQLSAGQGSHRVGLPSLADVEAFLVPLTAEEILSAGMGGRLNYLEPATLASWVRDIIGDPDLADALDVLVASDRAFGLLVPEMKELLAERLAQCEVAISEG
jgi:hypothetical protein